ncbi:MAG: THUMP domain-containing protein [Candidatus Woesearchaeota archaeon]
MKAIAITNPGIEEVAALEIRELIGKKAKSISSGESVVHFDAEDYHALCILCYRTQSLARVLLLLESFEFSSIDDIGSIAKNMAGGGFRKLLTADTRFRVRCRREGNQDFSGRDVEDVIGKHIEGRVDLDSPEITIYAYIHGNKCHIGIDFAGFDLSKRHYRVFTHKDSLKATVAYALVRLSGYEGKGSLLDPFCTTGTIPIEAALYACWFPVNHYRKENLAFLRFSFIDRESVMNILEEEDRKIDHDKNTDIKGYDAMLAYVKASQKNAKIAGINKKVQFGKAEISWMDTKADKEQVDKVVTSLPPMPRKGSRKEGKKRIESIYRDFFYQCEFILNSKGRITITADSPEVMRKHAEDYGFTIEKEITAMQGKKQLNIFVIRK